MLFLQGRSGNRYGTICNKNFFRLWESEPRGFMGGAAGSAGRALGQLRRVMIRLLQNVPEAFWLGMARFLAQSVLMLGILVAGGFAYAQKARPLQTGHGIRFLARNPRHLRDRFQPSRQIQRRLIRCLSLWTLPRRTTPQLA